MELRFCDGCGSRIDDADFVAGRAGAEGELFYCPKCLRRHREAGRAPAAGKAVPHGAGAGATPAPRRTPEGGSRPPVPPHTPGKGSPAGAGPAPEPSAAAGRAHASQPTPAKPPTAKLTAAERRPRPSTAKIAVPAGARPARRSSGPLGTSEEAGPGEPTWGRTLANGAALFLGGVLLGFLLMMLRKGTPGGGGRRPRPTAPPPAVPAQTPPDAGPGLPTGPAALMLVMPGELRAEGVEGGRVRLTWKYPARGESGFMLERRASEAAGGGLTVTLENYLGSAPVRPLVVAEGFRDGAPGVQDGDKRWRDVPADLAGRTYLRTSLADRGHAEAARLYEVSVSAPCRVLAPGYGEGRPLGLGADWQATALRMDAGRARLWALEVAAPGRLTLPADGDRNGTVACYVFVPAAEPETEHAWKALDTVRAGRNEFTDAGAEPETDYEYRVCAFDRFGPTDWSAAARVRLPPADAAAKPPPAAPDGLAAAQTEDGSGLKVTWRDRSAGAAAGFVLERAEGAAPAGAPEVELVRYGGEGQAPAVGRAGTEQALVYGAPVVPGQDGEKWARLAPELAGLTRLAAAAGGADRSDLLVVRTSGPCTVWALTPAARGAKKPRWMGEDWVAGGVRCASTRATYASWKLRLDAGRELELGGEAGAGGPVTFAFAPADGGWAAAATPGRGVLEHLDRGLRPGTEYTYRVRSAGEGNDSLWSATATARFAGLEPLTAEVRAASPTELEVTLKSVPGEGWECLAQVYENTAAPANLRASPRFEAGEKVVRVGELKPETNYVVVVRASKGGTARETDKLRERTPAVPLLGGELSAEALTQTEVLLKWKGVQGSGQVEVRKAALGERDFRAFGEQGQFPAEGERRVTGLEAGTGYVFRLALIKRSGRVSSNPAEARTLEPGEEPLKPGAPAAPTELRAEFAAGRVKLSWKDNSEGEESFEVQRGVETRGRVNVHLESHRSKANRPYVVAAGGEQSFAPSAVRFQDRPAERWGSIVPPELGGMARLMTSVDEKNPDAAREMYTVAVPGPCEAILPLQMSANQHRPGWLAGSWKEAKFAGGAPGWKYWALSVAEAGKVTLPCDPAGRQGAGYVFTGPVRVEWRYRGSSYANVPAFEDATTVPGEEYRYRVRASAPGDRKSRWSRPVEIAVPAPPPK